MEVALLFVIFVTNIALNYGACPKIVSREEWSAQPPKEIVKMDLPGKVMMIHHGEGRSCSTMETCAALVRDLQDLHMGPNELYDIRFHFLIGGDGNVYEGRGWNVKGQHSYINAYSFGLCFLGTFDAVLPPPEALAIAQELIQCGVDEGFLTSNYTLIGHRQDIGFSDCPGDRLFAEIQTWPHFGPKPE